MPGIFSRRKKDGKSKKNGLDDSADLALQKQKWDDAWTRKTVEPEEVRELLCGCTEELKNRGLDHPFFLLPFRPTSNPSAVRTFIRNFFSQNPPISGELLLQELRMTDPMVISGVAKWCWSRLQGGLVGWDAYELFKVGERDSNMARDSFKTFIPLSVENAARQQIIFDFFSLIAAVAAHGKNNGFGGRKLSRMASWWTFEHNDTGNGFDGGYGSWLSAADATSHLFFAYLRSLSPEQNPTGITMLPRSLQKLLQETEYPPQRPELLMVKTKKVAMIVETVSPTPFALLRRANHFQYRDSDRELQEFSSHEDPVEALTDECQRVLKAISSANQSQVSSIKHSTGLRDASWSRFEDIGFASSLEEEDDGEGSAIPNRRVQQLRQFQGLRGSPLSGGNGVARPTTPSWADFLSAGFVDDNQSRPNYLLPPDKILPPLSPDGRHSSQSHYPRLESERDVEPGELASIRVVDLDDAFWWVWMSSLAPEETPERKSAFGRCAVIETEIRGSRWLVMEEIIAGAAPSAQEGAYIAEKKGLFSWGKRSKTISKRKKSLDKNHDKGATANANDSKASIGPDAHAKIQAKAAQLRAQKDREEEQRMQAIPRRGRTDAELLTEKTNSVFTLQPLIVGEASSAMKWVNKYDKGTIKDMYMAHDEAGRGTAFSPAQSELVVNQEPADDGLHSPSVPPKDNHLTPAASPLPHGHSALSLVPENVLEEARSRSPLPEKAETPVPPAHEPSLPTPPKEEPAARVMSPTFDGKASMDTPRSPEPAKQQKTSGFRKLFGRKKRNSKNLENVTTDLNKMLEQNSKKSIEQPMASPAVVSPLEPGTPVEAAPTGEPIYEPIYEQEADDNDAHADAQDEGPETEHDFSRFDQGPLDDVPAFVPDEDDDDEFEDAVPQPASRSARPEPPLHDAPEPPRQAPKYNSKLPVKEGGPAGPGGSIQDRWAQLRKASERPPPRQVEVPYAKPTKPTDGDETSGEETIESRVARIKARVAELTNNMEGTSVPLRN
ncbi:hypothetical protein ACSS6W_004873 [Trichoderma asperelloides]|uniref:Morphogenesis-related protein MSB1 n=1 Tax=Trichoderma asperellum TaxID=101201 RepID=A0A6V8R245_TRIAP|nr:hypothetical protein LI328DRAFT_75372 [Trichoderma asperelloides]GFP56633.1 morphogenesis-related protein MSB1 [Trichoderma asperellum]